MKSRPIFRPLALLVALAGLAAGTGRAAPDIRLAPGAGPRQRLAAAEIRRYVYLRTGELLEIRSDGTDGSAGTDARIYLKADPGLAVEAYRLKTEGPALTISGGTDLAVLYGAYAFVEKLGVRFLIDGDVLPDERMPFALPALDETHAPLFELRGLLPFHDFPEGPDWWTRDDWKAILGQAVKMRMNFVGLHTYPWHNRDLGPEPTVWVGLPEDVNEDGTVKVSDPTSWYSTAKFQPYGCYRPAKTGGFSFGADQVFPADDYGPEVNAPEDHPLPKTPAAGVALMNRTGAMLRDVFTEARSLGMKTCVGTESPLDIPDGVAARLKELGMDPKAPATLQKLYEGMFLRIQRAFPVDYYWIWGHEGEIDQARFVTNLQCARAALASIKAPFRLGICGWGWITGNFPALDKALDRDVVFSAISMSVGNAPVSPNFERLGDRPKWAIPWFEDDGALNSPQFHVGRMRKDAVDARAYGCNGLMGLHWRTRVISPNIAALAQAGWEQGAWSRPVPADATPREVVVLGGHTASFFNNPVTGSPDVPLYQSVRYNLKGYRFAMPDGPCRVTLRFCEPAYAEAGKRVFGVRLQGKEVLRGLDVFARVGQNKALDLSYDGIVAAGGELRVEFVPEVEFPCIAAIEVSGGGVTRKVTCGGPACQDFAADPAPLSEPRLLPVADFYADWATAQFGTEAGPAIAEIFSRLDGKFPRASAWLNGPGVIAVNRQPWAQVEPQYAFVAEMEAQADRVRGAGCRDRFAWWLGTFRYARAMAKAACVRGELDLAMQEIGKLKGADDQLRLAREKALPLRLELVRAVGEMTGHLLSIVHNASELGSLVNVEQQSLLRTGLLTGHDKRLEQLLGGPLPPEAQPWRDYRGPARLVVLTARTMASRGATLELPVLALDAKPVVSVNVFHRALGTANGAG
ncbi:MAG: malectin domain-containing carbohydrate-binding protein [Kiritimatiellia bacterium]